MLVYQKVYGWLRNYTVPNPWGINNNIARVCGRMYHLFWENILIESHFQAISRRVWARFGHWQASFTCQLSPCSHSPWLLHILYNVVALEENHLLLDSHWMLEVPTHCIYIYIAVYVLLMSILYTSKCFLFQTYSICSMYRIFSSKTGTFVG